MNHESLTLESQRIDYRSSSWTVRDGRIYGTGGRGSQVGLYLYDPKLGKVVKDFGPVGPKHPNGAWAGEVVMFAFALAQGAEVRGARGLSVVLS